MKSIDNGESREMIKKINILLNMSDSDMFITKVTEVMVPNVHYRDFQFRHNDSDMSLVKYILRIHDDTSECIETDKGLDRMSEYCILKKIGEKIIENSTL